MGVSPARCDAAALAALVAYATRTGGSPVVAISHKFIATGEVLSEDERGTRSTGFDEFRVYWVDGVSIRTLWSGSWGPWAEEAASEARAAVLAALPAAAEGEVVVVPWRVDCAKATPKNPQPAPVGCTIVRVTTRTEQYLEARYVWGDAARRERGAIAPQVWRADGGVWHFRCRVSAANLVSSRARPGMFALRAHDTPVAWLTAAEVAAFR